MERCNNVIFTTMTVMKLFPLHAIVMKFPPIFLEGCWRFLYHFLHIFHSRREENQRNHS
ncbi:hypothetical protein Pint_26216 [Pistacia integerrima]|uniref:Uncharacterized protein n=1 Tax=Pistacia integerrima TaxID=434235 RepID=A0ACC0YFE8_9ROSI|nr:hypothetical protein Pint_26216 [Pistacia integerrima]